MSSIISGTIVICIVLIPFLFLLKKKKESLSKSDDYVYKINLDLKKSQQEWADAKLISNVKREALDMFEQWLRGHVILIYRPIAKVIMNYYPCESKYTSEDLSKIRNEEFNRLKTEYETKYGTNRNGSLLDYRKS